MGAHLRVNQARMEALAKMMAAVVDNVNQSEEDREELKENKANLKQEAQLDIKSMRSAIRGVLKTLVTEEENWIVSQAKRKREKEDVYLNHPGLDPVFMKINTFRNINKIH